MWLLRVRAKRSKLLLSPMNEPAGQDFRRRDQVTEDLTVPATMGEVRSLRPPAKAADPSVTFDRRELREILDLYGRKVAAGEWRDYAIDFTREKAIFSIFRRAAEYPLYRVVKDPASAAKQGAFSVVTTTGLVLKRGSDLKHVLAVLDRKLKLVTI